MVIKMFLIREVYGLTGMVNFAMVHTGARDPTGALTHIWISGLTIILPVKLDLDRIRPKWEYIH